MSNVYANSLELHKKLRGKIEISPKFKNPGTDDIPLLYTPGVAEASRVIAADKKLVYEYTGKGNNVLVISDGTAILGLGDLGPEAALPVMEGKALLFKELAGIDAYPICLDEKDPLELIKIIKALAPIAGAINLEDISAPRCFEIERTLQRELAIPVMHDDQHGTATVVLAGLINALKVCGIPNERDVQIVINGVGAAGTAITNMLLQFGFTNIILCDSRGIINREREDLGPIKQELVRVTNVSNKSGKLADALLGAKVFIGVSKGKLLTEENVKSMEKDSIIFALSNPEPEIMPEAALEAGAKVVATGRSDFPNQVNNALAYPGIFKGALEYRISQFENKMFIKAAIALAGLVEDPSPTCILPTLFDKRTVPVIAKTFAN